MTFGRALLIAFFISAVCAGILALVSRTPAEIREPRPGVTSTAGDFTEAQITRHGAYRGPLYLAFVLSLAIQVILLLLFRDGPIAQVVGWSEGLGGGWPVRTALLAAVVAGSMALVGLPLAFVRGFVLQRAWHLSNQDIGAWLLDQAKGFGLSLVFAAIAALAFYAVVRWQPRTWWLWGAGAFSVLTVVLVFLFPVVIAPLFNRFTPLSDNDLRTRIEALAVEAGVDVDEVSVADASKRSSAENAYVAGLGVTKQIILYDTLLEAGGPDETLFVVAHELAHEREAHVLKGVGISAMGLLAGFGVLAWLVERGSLLRWAGVESLGDLRTLPILLLFALVAGLLLQPVQNAISRSFERHADAVAYQLVGDTEPAVRAFRRLAISNIADLRPPAPIVWFFFSHPPIDQRIAAARDQDSI